VVVDCAQTNLSGYDEWLNQQIEFPFWLNHENRLECVLQLPLYLYHNHHQLGEGMGHERVWLCMEEEGGVLPICGSSGTAQRHATPLLLLLRRRRRFYYPCYNYTTTTTTATTTTAIRSLHRSRSPCFSSNRTSPSSVVSNYCMFRC